MARDMQIVTPLDPDALLFHGMYAREELSRLSEYQLDLLSPKNDVKFDGLLGKSVTVKLALAEDKTRYYNGYVTRISQVGTLGRYTRYLATVRPWLWFLTRTADCRIFQDMTVPDIVAKVFGDHSTADFKKQLTGTYRTWNYCVQYRETDFNFVSRLLEQEGIYYYFTHADGRHTLVLADSPTAHQPFAGYETIKFRAPESGLRPEIEHVHNWAFAREIEPGVYAHDDFDFERPSVELLAKKSHIRSHDHADYELYDFPGEYLMKPDGEQYAGARIEELAAQYEIASASTNARGLCVGSVFTLEDQPRQDQNREYVVLSANYNLQFSDYESIPESPGAAYSCSFECMSSKQQFRPARTTPKPSVQGPQTAIVVGPSGDEIYTDKYGRVKVQFHWDRYGKKDENTSCWMRVSYAWAGKGWGAVHIPRIGQEVIVDFLEGDPDEPIVVGRVYNAEQMPPYDLPGNKTQSGIKSRSSQGGGPANFNELRFEDKKGSELVTLHAEKDQSISVENDESHSVGHDRTKSVGHDETTSVTNNRTESVGNNETISIGANRTEKVGSNENINVIANRSEVVGANESVTIGGMKSETIAIAKALTIGAAYQVTVGAAMNESIGGAKAEEIGGAKVVAVGGVSSENVAGSKSTNAGGSISEAAASDITNKAGGKFAAVAGSDFAASAGGKMGLSATGDFSISGSAKGAVDLATELTVTCGSASITLKSGGEISIKGTDITIDGSGKVSIHAGGDIVLKGSTINAN
jgi:type VI secretion system secreted protein VgrG